MNDRQRIKLAAAAADRLALLARTLDVIVDGSTVMGRIRDHQGGLRAKTYDGAPATMRHDATFAGTLASDPAIADERELDRCIKAAADSVNKAWAVVAAYPPAHNATDADRLALGRLNARPEPSCANCARIEGERGGPRHEPIRADLRGPTDVGGRLAEPLHLCDWCYGCVRSWGRVPSTAELTKHHRGERVGWPRDVKPRPA